ncbi:acyl-CoA dehydrogenase [Pseudooceanicola sp. 216_PA32_1]|uniref:Acyl-[acyl-carrier-protein] dehydrogenase MbtN n=1 Tax=Pseudooceanicola pacificus TaxID=2676438 RepID=A0A844WDN4_9RHOB|nr:acyl-CoA dehydrogenase family protein [Pseudooceanicola pacificus]MWB79308.1 acyl-CoA dehydrogenase [Pseudooceanicola pacificus]
MQRPYREDHEAYRDSFRRFVEAEIVPHHGDWEKAHIVPKSVWRRAGELGFLLPAIPEAYGGGGGDFGHSAVIMEELAKVHASGPGFSLHSDIVAPYLMNFGSEAQKRQWLPMMARGEVITAIAMTEPGTGSDLKNIKTHARREGDHYVISGQKTFITNGHNAGLYIVACKTDPEAGRKGVSLILVEDTRDGFSRGRSIEKLGQHAQDTAELFFDEVRVPVTNRLGEEGKGFSYLMRELGQERLIIAIRAATMMEQCLAETIAYTKGREAFGQPVFEFQTAKFRLAEAAAECEMLRCYIDSCLAEHLVEKISPEKAAKAKLVSTELLGRWLDIFLQLHGGYGYTTEYSIGRAWTDARVFRIYGGSSEIMREIISRTL